MSAPFYSLSASSSRSPTTFPLSPTAVPQKRRSVEDGSNLRHPNSSGSKRRMSGEISKFRNRQLESSPSRPVPPTNGVQYRSRADGSVSSGTDSTRSSQWSSLNSSVSTDETTPPESPESSALSLAIERMPTQMQPSQPTTKLALSLRPGDSPSPVLRPLRTPASNTPTPTIASTPILTPTITNTSTPTPTTATPTGIQDRPGLRHLTPSDPPPRFTSSLTRTTSSESLASGSDLEDTSANANAALWATKTAEKEYPLGGWILKRQLTGRKRKDVQKRFLLFNQHEGRIIPSIPKDKYQTGLDLADWHDYDIVKRHYLNLLDMRDRLWAEAKVLEADLWYRKKMKPDRRSASAEVSDEEGQENQSQECDGSNDLEELPSLCQDEGGYTSEDDRTHEFYDGVDSDGSDDSAEVESDGSDGSAGVESDGSDGSAGVESDGSDGVESDGSSLPKPSNQSFAPPQHFSSRFKRANKDANKDPEICSDDGPSDSSDDEELPSPPDLGVHNVTSSQLALARLLVSKLTSGIGYIEEAAKEMAPDVDFDFPRVADERLDEYEGNHPLKTIQPYLIPSDPPMPIYIHYHRYEDMIANANANSTI